MVLPQNPSPGVAGLICEGQWAEAGSCVVGCRDTERKLSIHRFEVADGGRPKFNGSDPLSLCCLEELSPFFPKFGVPRVWLLPVVMTGKTSKQRRKKGSRVGKGGWASGRRESYPRGEGLDENRGSSRVSLYKSLCIGSSPRKFRLGRVLEEKFRQSHRQSLFATEGS